MLVALLLAGAAHAQSSVNITGIMDAAARSVSGHDARSASSNSFFSTSFFWISKT